MAPPSRRRGLRRAGSRGWWRLLADRVPAGKFLVDPGFRCLCTGSGCRCSPGLRSGIAARARVQRPVRPRPQSRPGPGPARLPPGPAAPPEPAPLPTSPSPGRPLPRVTARTRLPVPGPHLGGMRCTPRLASIWGIWFLSLPEP